MLWLGGRDPKDLVQGRNSMLGLSHGVLPDGKHPLIDGVLLDVKTGLLSDDHLPQAIIRHEELKDADATHIA